MAKPQPKPSSAPTGQPTAVPPRTREESERQHPWEPAVADAGAPARTPAPPPGQPRERVSERPDAPAEARPSGRPRARARGKTPDQSEWSRQISGSALKVGAARRKLTQRENELSDLIRRARAAGVDDSVITAWVVAAGLNPDDVSPSDGPISRRG